MAITDVLAPNQPWLYLVIWGGVMVAVLAIGLIMGLSRRRKKKKKEVEENQTS